MNRLQKIVVTAANDVYFSYAADLVASVRQDDDSTPFGILDVGLTAAQRSLLEDKGVQVSEAQWEYGGERQCSRTFLAMLSRPFLPKYFPGYDVIVYIDADAWVQSPAAVGELAQEARQGDLAAAVELHVAFPHLYQAESPLKTYLKGTYEAVFGKPSGPLIPADVNCGVFAAASASFFWMSWQHIMTKAVSKIVRQRSGGLDMNRPEDFFLESNCLNYGFKTGIFGIRPVAPTYNWVCEFAMPLYDPERGLLTEPTAPYEPIRIVHLCDAGRRVEFLFDRHGNRHAVKPRWGGIQGIRKEVGLGSDFIRA